MDHEGIKPLLRRADAEFLSLKHLWLDAGYRGEDQGQGLGGECSGVDGRDGRAPAKARLEGDADEVVGRTMVARRDRGGLEEAYPAQRVRGAAAPLGSGALLRVDLSQTPDEQGLRAAVLNERSIRLSGDDAPNAQTHRPRLTFRPRGRCRRRPTREPSPCKRCSSPCPPGRRCGRTWAAPPAPRGSRRPPPGARARCRRGP